MQHARFTASPTAGALFALIQAGRAKSRADLARVTGLSASTVAQRVEELSVLGYVEEVGRGPSTGGRRPRSLALSTGTHLVAAVDLGESHATVGIMNRRGELVAHRTEAITIADGPASVIHDIVVRCRAAVAAVEGGPYALEGIAMSLPGPVDSRDSRLVSPSRMPGWNGVAVGELVEQESGLPALVDNDANVMAMGEYLERGADSGDLVFVKAGSGIGCGIIASGMLHHGFRGVAGDISHVALKDVDQIPCSCGRVGCLDVVASGHAVRDGLRAAGVDVAGVDEVLAIASDAHPLATRLLREAGKHTGEVLATIINFFNPRSLVLGGRLSTSDAFVAGVRQEVYTQCLPLATDFLEISVSRTGRLGGVNGIGWMLLQRLLDPDRIDRELREQRTRGG